MAAAGVVELLVFQAVVCRAGLDLARGHALVGREPFSANLGRLKALVGEEGELGDAFRGWAPRAGRAMERRNQVVHSAWSMDQDDEALLQILRTRRLTSEYLLHTTSVADLEALGVELLRLATELLRMDPLGLFRGPRDAAQDSDPDGG